jgi:hypothetical protein
MSSPRLRTPGDRARADLYYHGKALRESGRQLMDRETLLREGGSIDALCFHMTADDIRRLDDETAILLVEWNPDLMGSRLGPSFMREVLEPDPQDTFFAASAIAEDESNSGEASASGRNEMPRIPPRMLREAVDCYVEEHRSPGFRDEDILRDLRQAHRDYRVPRDPVLERVRQLMPNRKPGPRSIREENSAE